jgi:hypothetical protein
MTGEFPERGCASRIDRHFTCAGVIGVGSHSPALRIGLAVAGQEVGGALSIIPLPIQPNTAKEPIITIANVTHSFLFSAGIFLQPSRSGRVDSKTSNRFGCFAQPAGTATGQVYCGMGFPELFWGPGESGALRCRYS